MSDLIISYLIQSHHGNPHGFRVFEDGLVEAYQVSRTVKAPDGSFQEEMLTPDWYTLTTMNDDLLAELKEAVRESGIANMPTDLNDAGNVNSSKTSSAEWQVGMGDDLKTIHVKHWVPDSSNGEALLELRSQIGETIGKID